MDNLRRKIAWPTTIILSIVFVISTVVYFSSSQNLVRPAGLAEDFQFWWYYGLSLISGSVFNAVLVMMFLCSLGSFLRLVLGDFWEYSVMQAIIFVVVNWVITVIIAIIHRYFAISIHSYLVTNYFRALLSIAVIGFIFHLLLKK